MTLSKSRRNLIVSVVFISILLVSISFSGLVTIEYEESSLETDGSEPGKADVFYGGPKFENHSQTVHSMVNQTQEDNLHRYIDTLQHFENEDGVRTRRDGTEGFWEAVNWTYDKLESFGLDVHKENFTYDGEKSTNVIGEIPGSHPEIGNETYIIGAHLDSINGEGEEEPAPGADDNGSGMAVMIETARILSEYRFHRTVKFVAWGAEEVGLQGSSYHASNIDTEEVDVRGKLNYDMVGYAEEEKAITIHANSRSNWMLDYKANVSEAYEIDMNITYKYNSDFTASDHASFWEKGYNATFTIETAFNPHYHTENDTLDKLTISQIDKTTSHALATLTHLAGLAGNGNNQDNLF